jgi:nocardicin N-oxygenase
VRTNQDEDQQEVCPVPYQYPLPCPHAAEPPPLIAALREQPGLARLVMTDGEEGRLVCRYAEVKAVVADGRFASRFPGVNVESEELNQLAEISDLLFTKRGAEHTRIRRLVSKAFTARYVEGLRPAIGSHADRLLDEVEKAGPGADFVELFAVPYVIDVIADLLDVRVDDRADLRRWIQTSLASLELDEYTSDDVLEAVFQMLTYASKLIAQKRERLGTDLLSELISVYEADERRLTDKELLGLVLTILAAAYAPTVATLVRGLLLLLSEPARYAALRDDPSLIPSTVEEILRLEAANGDLMRVATEELTVGEETVRDGDLLVVSLPGANRDPAVFDDPETFRMDRSPNPHLAFGHGPHFCLGAGLARVELQIAYQRLTARMPDLRLAVPYEDLVWQTGVLISFPEHVPVSW